MKCEFFLIVILTAACALNACISGGYSRVDYIMIKNSVPANVKNKLVDPAKVRVGEYAVERFEKRGKVFTRSVSVVGKTAEGYKIIEYLKPYQGNTMGIAMIVDQDGNVKEAWGGLLGQSIVKLPVAPGPADSGKAESDESETKTIASKKVVGFKAKGRKWDNGTYFTSTWKNDDFPFFGCLLKREFGLSKPEVLDRSEVIEHKKEGAASKIPPPIE